MWPAREARGEKEVPDVLDTATIVREAPDN